MKSGTLRWLVVGILAGPGTLPAASLLPGDNVQMIYNPGAINVISAVGPGDEYSVGVFQFDFNSGPNGDVFAWSSVGNGFSANVTSITLSGLAFSDSSTLVGFDVLPTSWLSGVTVSTTPTSVVISFNPAPSNVGPGVILSGRYITTTSNVAEPGTLALLSLGSLGLALTRRRAVRPT